MPGSSGCPTLLPLPWRRDPQAQPYPAGIGVLQSRELLNGWVNFCFARSRLAQSAHVRNGLRQEPTHISTLAGVVGMMEGCCKPLWTLKIHTAFFKPCDQQLVFGGTDIGYGRVLEPEPNSSQKQKICCYSCWDFSPAFARSALASPSRLGVKGEPLYAAALGDRWASRMNTDPTGMISRTNSTAEIWLCTVTLPIQFQAAPEIQSNKVSWGPLVRQLRGPLVRGRVCLEGPGTEYPEIGPRVRKGENAQLARPYPPGRLLQGCG